MSTAILREVTAALKVDGFTLKLGPSRARFQGAIIVRGHRLLVRFDYDDLEFSAPPRVFIQNPEVLPRPVLPHLDESGELCVVERRAFVSDRYRAAGQARGLVVRTAELVERGLTRHATSEIAAEFPAHWGGNLFEIDSAPFSGPVQALITPGRALRVGPRTDLKQPSIGTSVTTNIHLSFRDTQARPNTVEALLDWAISWDSAMASAIVDGLGEIGPNDPLVVIHAPNGVVGFRVLVSAQGARRVSALAKGSSWRRVLSSPFGRKLRIERLRARRSDLAHALERNGGGTMPLSGKQIAVVGCGSIGGFLAKSLAQLGAGFQGGRLILIDDEALAVENVGRHFLGMADVGKRKVDGCREAIISALPGCEVTPRSFVVQSQRSLLDGLDLICDATGEQGVSEMINDWMIAARRAQTKFPDVLHVWIEGMGVGVQTFLGSDPSFACLRCLTPEHAAPPRFSPRRDQTETVLPGPCGEQPFTPYGPSAPMAAASLASQHAADWAEGRRRPLLRTLRLDWTETKEIKPTSPAVSPRCPACQPR